MSIYGDWSNGMMRSALLISGLVFVCDIGGLNVMADENADTDVSSKQSIIRVRTTGEDAPAYRLVHLDLEVKCTNEELFEIGLSTPEGGYTPPGEIVLVYAGAENPPEQADKKPVWVLPVPQAGGVGGVPQQPTYASEIVWHQQRDQTYVIFADSRGMRTQLVVYRVPPDAKPVTLPTQWTVATRPTWPAMPNDTQVARYFESRRHKDAVYFMHMVSDISAVDYGPGLLIRVRYEGTTTPTLLIFNPDTNEIKPATITEVKAEQEPNQ